MSIGAIYRTLLSFILLKIFILVLIENPLPSFTKLHNVVTYSPKSLFFWIKEFCQRLFVKSCLYFFLNFSQYIVLLIIKKSDQIISLKLKIKVMKQNSHFLYARDYKPRLANIFWCDKIEILDITAIRYSNQ